MILAKRIKPLNNKGIIAGNPYVLCWMQSAQRAECNHALEYAVRQANLMGKPLLVYSGVTEGFPEGNARHCRFMLEGLKETGAALKQRNIRLLVRHISPEKGALELSGSAVATVTDRGYLKVQRAWRGAGQRGRLQSHPGGDERGRAGGSRFRQGGVCRDGTSAQTAQVAGHLSPAA